jgi:hypothetical protein
MGHFEYTARCTQNKQTEEKYKQRVTQLCYLFGVTLVMLFLYNFVPAYMTFVKSFVSLLGTERLPPTLTSDNCAAMQSSDAGQFLRKQLGNEVSEYMHFEQLDKKVREYVHKGQNIPIPVVFQLQEFVAQFHNDQLSWVVPVLIIGFPLKSLIRHSSARNATQFVTVIASCVINASAMVFLVSCGYSLVLYAQSAVPICAALKACYESLDNATTNGRFECQNYVTWTGTWLTAFVEVFVQEEGGPVTDKRVLFAIGVLLILRERLQAKVLEVFDWLLTSEEDTLGNFFDWLSGREGRKKQDIDDTITVQLNIWDDRQAGRSKSGSSGKLYFYTLCKLPLHSLFVGQSDSEDLHRGLKEAAVRTVDRHGVVFLDEKIRDRVMSMLQNAVSERYRQGFVMNHVDELSVEKKCYQMVLTNETGGRVGGYEKLRLFIADGSTLDKLAGEVDFETLSNTMERNWACKDKAERMAFNDSFTPTTHGASPRAQKQPLSAVLVATSPIAQSLFMPGKSDNNWGPFGLRMTDKEFSRRIIVLPGTSGVGGTYSVDRESRADRASSRDLLEEWPRSFQCQGKCSGSSDVTVPKCARHRFRIPSEAERFVFVYPACDIGFEDTEFWRNLSEKSSCYSLLIFGGFLYLDGKGNVVSANALAESRHKNSPDLKFESTEDFSVEQLWAQRPKLFQPAAGPCLAKMREAAGTNSYCWIPPNMDLASQAGGKKRKLDFGGFAFRSPSGVSQAVIMTSTWSPTDLGELPCEELGGLKPEFEYGKPNWKRWQTLVEVAKMKQDQHGQISVWPVTIFVPKGAPENG